MWIVRIALSRPYTFIVLALLILIVSPIVILRTPTDIFPNIDIPVIAAVWTYTGLNAEEMEGRMTSVYERVLTTAVNNIEHIESMTVNGRAVVKIFLQPGASVDAATAQVTAASQSILRQMPPGVVPPFILTYNASSVPIIQLALSSKVLSESHLNDLGLNFIRPQLVTVPGAAVPYPYGGKSREVNVSLDTARLQAKGLSPADVVTAIGNQNLILPAGTAKIGQFEYDVDLNSSPAESFGNERHADPGGEQQSHLHPRCGDGFGRIRAADEYCSARRAARHAGIGSEKWRRLDLERGRGRRKILPRIQATLPPELKIQPLADQSIFVRAAISGVIREGVIAACLTGLMILIFLGSWRSTLIIAVSIPLSILTSVCVLSAMQQTINIMTLGGLALAVGILVDDATVTIENIERYLEEGHDLHFRHSRGRGADRGSGAGFDALHLHRLSSDVLPERRGEIPFRAAGRSGGFRDARVLCVVANAGADACDVPASSASITFRNEHGTHSNCFSERFERGFERMRLSYQALLTTLVYRRYHFCARISGALRLRSVPVSVAGPGLLSDERQRPVPAARPREDGHADRRDGAALRPDRPIDPANDSARRNSEASWTTSACRTAASTPPTTIAA